MWTPSPAFLPVSQERGAPSPAGPAREFTASWPDISRKQDEPLSSCTLTLTPGHEAVGLHRHHSHNQQENCLQESWDTPPVITLSPSLIQLSLLELLSFLGPSQGNKAGPTPSPPDPPFPPPLWAPSVHLTFITE